MKNIRNIFVKLAVALAAAAVFGFNAHAASDIRMNAPAVVSQSEQFRIEFIIEGDKKVSDFSWAGTSDFDVVWGPQTSSSSSFQSINGKTTRSITKTYSYVLLPKNTGVFTVPVATAKIDGKQVSSNSVKIEVLAASGGAQGGAPSGSQAQQGSSSRGSSSQTSSQPAGRTDSSSDLFMTLDLSKTNVVVGESITATLKFYQRTNVVGFEGASFPKFEGFWSTETFAPSNIEFTRENYNGVPYDVAVLRRYNLIPQHSGTLTVDPAEVVALVNVRRRSSGNSFFDDFFDSGISQERRRVMTPERKVTVSELPAGAPASFSGAVGSDFKISAELSKDTLSAHEAAILKVKISGTGNISLVKAPKVAFPLDFETYDAKSSEQIAANSLSGVKTYEYPIIPRSSGDFEIEPIEYPYFNTATRKYVTVSTAAIPVQVVKGSADEPVTLSQGLSRPAAEGVKSLAEDIRYIYTSVPKLSKKDNFFVFTPVFWSVILALALIALIAVFALRKAASMQADVAMTKTRKASRAALGKLKLSKTYLDRGIRSGFYEELHRALVGYVCDKLGMPISEFTKENVSEALLSRGVPQELVDRYVGILNDCEWARYAPASESDQMKDHYEAALNVITNMDACIKTPKKGGAAKLIAIIIAVGLGGQMSLSAQSSPIDTLWNRAVASYSAADYQGALEAFRSINDAGSESPELLANIGSCHYKMGNEAMAVVYYRRALRLDPSYKDAKYNLEVVQTSLRDRIDTLPQFIFKTWSNAICYSLSSNAWAVLCVVMFALFLLGCVLFFAGRSSGLRKAGFFGGIAALVLSLMCLGYAAKIRKEYSAKDQAVVTQGVVAVKNAPATSGSTDLFILHEGTVVRIIDQVGSFYNIEISDGRTGWMTASSLEVI